MKKGGRRGIQRGKRKKKIPRIALVTESYVFKTHVACNVAHHGLVVRKDVRVHKGNRQVPNASLQQRQQRIAHPTEHVSRAQSMWYLSVGRAIHTTETTPAARACVRIRVGRRLDDQSLARAANHAPSIAVQRAPAVIAHHPLANLHDRLVPISQGQETEGNRNEHAVTRLLAQESRIVIT